MPMDDLDKEYHPRLEGSTHLDDDSSLSESARDPLELPSVLPPLEDVEEAKLPDEEPPPNGGLQAWLQVLGSFFLFFNSW
jgi:hypothetical protein